MHQKISKSKQYFNYRNLADALFVLSQQALRMKFEMMLLQHKIKSNELAEFELLQNKQAYNRLNKEYKLFQQNKLVVLRHLILDGRAKLENFITVKGVPYGLVSFYNHKFYVIINKKIVKYYSLANVGDSFPDFTLIDLLELEDKYLNVKDANKLFKNYFKFAISSSLNQKNERRQRFLEKEETIDSGIKVQITETKNVSSVVVKKRPKK